MFYDTQERQIPNQCNMLVSIPKLEIQWKVMFDVKPTEHLERETPRKLFITIFIDVDVDAIQLYMLVSILHKLSWEGLSAMMTTSPVPGMLSLATRFAMLKSGRGSRSATRRRTASTFSLWQLESSKLGRRR